MTTQKELFPAVSTGCNRPAQIPAAVPPRPVAAFVRGSNSSAAAAREIGPLSNDLRRRVFNFLVDCGPAGATDTEIANGTRLQGDCARPRRIELVREGLVVASARRRLTPAGRAAVVWLAISAGISREMAPADKAIEDPMPWEIGDRQTESWQ